MTKSYRRSRTLLTGVMLMGFLNCQAGDKKAPEATGTVRKPAVAGQFYTGNASALRAEVQRYLAAGSRLDSPVRMLISPHAGFVFSGPVAGKGYATIDKSISRVFIIGPSHHAWFTGVSIAEVDSYETPLGRVPLDKTTIAQLRKHGMVHANQQADWPEHSLEVQLPFLQVVLSGFSIIPIVCGRVEPAEVATLVEPFLDEKTLVVASSDLSHYDPSAQAKRIDAATLRCILDGNAKGEIEACGETPIRVVMTLAKRLGLTPKLLDARNSYETAPGYGSEDRVVGYASVAYVKASATAPAPDRHASAAPAAPGDIPADVKTFLLTLARRSLEANVRSEKFEPPNEVPAMAKENSGCFVTLTKQGELRGCIGYIEPTKPLYVAVMENASNAALSDPRFPRVMPSELGDLDVEVSVLTKPEPLPFSSPEDLLSKLVPGRDGIILQKGWRQSTFLPQVWEQLPDKVEFLEHLAAKGGMDRDGWKDAAVKRYFAIHFKESR